MEGVLPIGWNDDIPVFPPDAKGMASRIASGKVMNAVASRLPLFVGGSADLNPSTYTALKDRGDFESPEFSPWTGRALQGESGVMQDAISISACANMPWERP